jgi:hypothetical protein
MKDFDPVFKQSIQLHRACDLIFQCGKKARLYLESEGGPQRAMCIENQ